MIKLWQDFCETVNQKNIRERALLFATAIVIVYAAFDYLILESLNKKKVKLEKRLVAANQEVKKLTAQEKVLAQAMTNDPNANKRKEITRLHKQVEKESATIAELSAGLIPAENLPQALHDVLSINRALALVGMETKAPTQLKLEGFAQSTDAASESEESVGVYKHAVVLSLRGTYFEFMQYIEMLEALPWKFYWETLNYDVDKYPQADIVIEVYTLSLDRGVLGV